jgi:DNA topoisomerase-2
VNSIATTRGGSHVNYITDQIAHLFMEHLAKKHKGLKLKPFQIKNHVWVFINCLIENPTFDSQTKETLTLKASAFGSKIELDDSFFKKVLKGTSIMDSILSFGQEKQEKDMKKTDGKRVGRITGIPKLEDANDAGTRNAEHCTLILTEGDSAKALAVSGLAVVGRDRYGVFPLRGKVANPRDANHEQIMKNEEIKNLKIILGLQQGNKYENGPTGMRYGHVLIMADQDPDGSHIKGLLINLFHYYWPNLLRHPGFLQEFATPIVKAKKKSGKSEISFFTLQEYEEWRKEQADSLGSWTIKYYKGLGTSTSQEAKEYFSNLPLHQMNFAWEGAEDGEIIEMVFSKKRADDRKQWLLKYKDDVFVDHNSSEVSYSEFVNKELIHFSMMDNTVMHVFYASDCSLCYILTVLMVCSVPFHPSLTG